MTRLREEGPYDVGLCKGKNPQEDRMQVATATMSRRPGVELYDRDEAALRGAVYWSDREGTHNTKLEKLVQFIPLAYYVYAHNALVSPAALRHAGDERRARAGSRFSIGRLQ